MYSKPEVIKLSSAVDAIQEQTPSSPKGLNLYADVFVSGHPITANETPAAYEADE
jgi:hypothetical protein